MTSWREFQQAEPDFARRVRAVFDIRRHKTLATLTAEGSPRISGIETQWDDESGELHLGMMPQSVKARDLARDSRLALHSPTLDPPEDNPSAWAGEAKISGSAHPDGPDRVRVDLRSVVLTRVGTPADHLVVEAWTPSTGLRRLAGS
jgi:hypothetical protein